MRRWLFWSSLPLLLPQALWVRSRTPRFAAPLGADAGHVHPTEPRGPPLHLVGIGDSIIAGVGADTADDCLLAQLAREISTRRGTAVRWRSTGRVGATTRRVLHQLTPQLPPARADVLLVSVGVNDVTSLRRRTGWSRDVRALADALAVHSPDTPALFLGLPPMQHFPALPPPLTIALGLRARLFDETLAETLAGHPTARHVPLSIPPSPGVFCADGFHPSPVAYARIAQLLADHLGAPPQNLQPKDTVTASGS